MPHPQDDRVIVAIIAEQVYGELVSLGAHASRIKYTAGGLEYDVYLPNEEFVVLNEKEDDD